MMKETGSRRGDAPLWWKRAAVMLAAAIVCVIAPVAGVCMNASRRYAAGSGMSAAWRFVLSILCLIIVFAFMAIALAIVKKWDCKVWGGNDAVDTEFGFVVGIIPSMLISTIIALLCIPGRDTAITTAVDECFITTIMGVFLLFCFGYVLDVKGLGKKPGDDSSTDVDVRSALSVIGERTNGGTK